MGQVCFKFCQNLGEGEGCKCPPPPHFFLPALPHAIAVVSMDCWVPTSKSCSRRSTISWAGKSIKCVAAINNKCNSPAYIYLFCASTITNFIEKLRVCRSVGLCNMYRHLFYKKIDSVRLTKNVVVWLAITENSKNGVQVNNLMRSTFHRFFL